MKQKDIFYIVVSSFVVIVIWITANLWHIQNVSKLSEKVLMQTTPISPTFDTQTLAKLKERSQAVPLFTIKTASPAAKINPIPTTLLSPTPTLELSPTISPLPIIEAIPTISP